MVMESTPLTVLLRRQLATLRNEATWALDALVHGHHPPHGFEIQVASALESIALAGLAAGDKCRGYAERIRSRPAEQWSVDDAKGAIALLDAALAELGGAR